MKELKPCPFCGKSEFHIKEGFGFYCTNCGWGTDFHDPATPEEEKRAIDCWNTRPIEDALHAVIDAGMIELAREQDAKRALKNQLAAMTAERDEYRLQRDIWREADRWIPVGERLPEPNVKVQIVYDDLCVEGEQDIAACVGTYGNGIWQIGPKEYLDRVYCYVHHWRPLPAPPAKEDEK